MRSSSPRSRPSRTIAAAVCAVLAGSSPGWADESTLAPDRDTTIYSESNNVSNGHGTGLFAGNTNTGATRRALIAFDVASAVPAGSTITAVQLELHVTRSIAGQDTVSVHRLLADWGESTSDASGNEGQGAPAKPGDATWRFRFFNTAQWQVNGGDFVGAASATAPAGDSGAVTWGSTAGMVADVQAWLDDPGSNFGWIVRGNETHDTTSKRFGSRENAVAALRPRLLLMFEPPAGATATSTATAMMATPTATAVSTATVTVTPEPTDTPTVPEVPTGTRTATSTAEPTSPSTATATSTTLATPTVTLTSPPAATPSATIEPPTATPTATPTTSPPICAGDCDGSGTVTINELITCVSIALGALPAGACPACDPSGSGTVEISDLIAAVNSALSGCPASGPSPVSISANGGG